MKKEKVDRSVWKKAMKMLETGEVTFSKAASIAGLDIWTFAERVKESGIVWVKIKPDELRKELKY